MSDKEEAEVILTYNEADAVSDSGDFCEERSAILGILVLVTVGKGRMKELDALFGDCRTV